MPATPTRDALAPTWQGLSPERPRPADPPPPGGPEAAHTGAGVAPPDAARPAGGPWPAVPADTGGTGADWTPITEQMPPEGMVVEADSPGGHRLRLKWQGRLWRFADGSHYLFHTPLYWRPLAEPAPTGRGPPPPAAPGVGRRVLGLLGWAVGVGPWPSPRPASPPPA